MRKFHFGIRRFAAVIIGLVFFVAGVLKIMDPVGAGLIVEEYFKFFGVAGLTPIAKPFAFVLSLIEALTGIALITGVFRKLSAIVASILICIFTIVTLILWIKNPEMDCGCFGEAIHLTHGQTFMKNVILLILALIAFLPFREFGQHKGHKRVAFWILAMSVLAMGIYSLMYIPVMDFTPFDLSSRLKAALDPNMAPPQEERFVTTFIYEKNGQEGVFTLDNLPDSTWTYVRTETVEKQMNIPTDDFPELAFRDAEGNYADSLAIGRKVMVVSAYAPEKVSDKRWGEISALLANAQNNEFTPLLLLASPQGEADKVIPAAYSDLLANAYYSDYKTLVSLNRSNGGATYFNSGDLIEKWAARSLPSSKDVEELAMKDTTDLTITSSTKGRLAFQAFFLYSVAILLLV